MTDDERREMEHRLHSSTDPEVWAKEFCALFAGQTITEGKSMADRVEEDGRIRFGPWLGPDTMLGWFANAMETAAFFQKMATPYTGKPLVDQEYEADWSHHAPS